MTSIAVEQMQPFPRRTRRIAALTTVTNLRCPVGHRIAYDFQPTEHGFRPCRHSYGPSSPKCGTWLYVIVLRGGAAFVSDATLEEVRALSSPLLTPTEILESLKAAKHG